MAKYNNFINHPLILIFVPILAIPLLFFSTTISMIHVWIVNETFTHGFLVFPISGWLIWSNRNKFLSYQPKPEPRVFMLFLILIFGWIVSSIVDVQVTQQFFMISVIIITVWISTGRKILSQILFPLLFLFFAVPFGQSLIPPLMEFTANFTVFMIKLTGIPIYREGLLFTLPSGNWSVVEECSGVRYLIASFALGTIYAYISFTTIKKRLIFIILSLIVPVFANGLRAYGIVMIGHLSGMELATGVDHLVYGWVFFGVVIFLLFYIGSFWWDPVENKLTSENLSTSGTEKTSGSPLTFLTLTLVVTALMVVYANHLNSKKLITTKNITLSLPDNFAGWQFDESRFLEWEPIFENPDVKINRGYIFGNDFVQLNIGYYQSQRQGAEAVSTNNHIASPLGGEWKKTTGSDIKEKEMYFTETSLKNSNLQTLVWHWYKIGKYKTPNPYIAKVIDAYNILIDGRTDASMITLSTPLDENIEVSRQRLRDFWSDASQEIDRSIERISLKN